MKIQELAIIFIIIILPISLLLSEYTQFQIQTVKTQSAYDAKLTAATYDAIKAFQLNTFNSTESSMANSKMTDLSASINVFRNSITSAFKLNGYTEEELNNYIPALVYTLYDGFYIYSPYVNENYRYIDPDSEDGQSITIENPTGRETKTDGNGDYIYGLKPYVSYSCRYVYPKNVANPSIDVVITYALDNYVTVQGTINGIYHNKSGYLIDNIECRDSNGDGVYDIVKYNGVDIGTEVLMEDIGGEKYKYIKEDGTKFYWDEYNHRIISIMNGEIKVKASEATNPTYYNQLAEKMDNNDSAQQYYIAADEFTEWFKSTDLVKLTYANAVDEVIGADGKITIDNVWDTNTTKIFDFNTTNIENELSNFNQHRLAVIRHKIETNLAIAISNYNNYSGVTNVFQMPQLKEDEWDQIIHNISLISFLQGLPIGGKIYNGYSLVTNSESEEVVLEQNIYILGDDKNYHKIGDKGFETGAVNVNAVGYAEGTNVASAGRLNLDFKRATLSNSISKYYYYPLEEYNASYDSVVMQNNVTTYEDIYAYVNSQSDELRIAFYTALGRERAGKYNSKIAIDTGGIE